MSETVAQVAAREYEYLRRQGGRDFFLALAPYVNALHGKRRIKRALRRIERETRDTLDRFVTQQTGFIAEAKRIRDDLAERAPEIDNSDMERPPPPSHERLRYDLDSFARFDELVDADEQIGYPTVARDEDAPGPVRDLIIILRGRLRAAQYGEDGDPNGEPIRDDLGDIGRKLGNLDERYGHAIRRYRQEARTLPGMAFARLVYFADNGFWLAPPAPPGPRASPAVALRLRSPEHSGFRRRSRWYRRRRGDPSLRPRHRLSLGNPPTPPLRSPGCPKFVGVSPSDPEVHEGRSKP